MRRPFISIKGLNNDGSKYFYVEQDSALTNLGDEHKEKFGAKPFIYIKMQSTAENPESYSRDGHQGGTTGPLYIHLAINKSDSQKSFVNIGKQNSESTYCGNGSVTVLGLEKEKKKWRPDGDFDPFRGGGGLFHPTYVSGPTTHINERPSLQRMGVVIQNDGTPEQVYGSTGGVGVQLGNGADGLIFNYNSSRESILEAWNNYSANKDGGQYAYNIRIKDTKGNVTIIQTFQELQQTFPSWFLINGEYISKSLSNIVGDKLASYGGKSYPASYVGLWQTFSSQGLSEKEVVSTLMGKGYSGQQINATRTASGLTPYELSFNEMRGVSTVTGAFSSEKLNLAPLSHPANDPNNPGGGSGGSGNSNGAGGGARSPNGKPWFGPEGYKPGVVQNVTVGRSRSILLTSEQVSDIVSYDQNQQVMYQVYIGSVDSSGKQQPILNQYKFDFAPNEVNYSGFGSEWISIDRSGTFPIVDWKSFRLMNIGFSFVIANNNNDLTAEGLESPITSQIETLQRMAQSPYPVMFYGFDKLLMNQFRYDAKGNPRGIQFVIQDFTLSSQRRNSKMEITRAQASLTLQEIPIETTAIIGMPRLAHKAERPPSPPPVVGEVGFGLFTDHLTVQGSDTLSYKATSA